MAVKSRASNIQSIGQLLIVGFDGVEMTPRISSLLTWLQPLGARPSDEPKPIVAEGASFSEPAGWVRLPRPVRAALPRSRPQRARPHPG